MILFWKYFVCLRQFSIKWINLFRNSISIFCCHLYNKYFPFFFFSKLKLFRVAWNSVLFYLKVVFLHGLSISHLKLNIRKNDVMMLWCSKSFLLLSRLIFHQRNQIPFYKATACKPVRKLKFKLDLSNRFLDLWVSMSLKKSVLSHYGIL